MVGLFPDAHTALENGGQTEANGVVEIGGGAKRAAMAGKIQQQPSQAQASMDEAEAKAPTPNDVGPASLILGPVDSFGIPIHY